MTDRGHVVVIGGGVIGAACAYFLAKSGWRVTIVERGQFGKGCSHGNCGFVCPSHVLPLAEPGAVRKTLKAMARSKSPFYIKPRFDLSLAGWLLNFARRCNQRDMLAAGRAIQPLLRSSMRLYDELLAAESIECEWEKRGLLFVFRTAGELDKYAETDRLLREGFDEPATRYDGAAVTQLEPALQDGLAGGWHYEDDAHLRPDRLMASWRSALVNQYAVTIREQCDLTGLQIRGGRVVAAETSSGEITADHFVVATGAMTGRWGKTLGCRIPIQPGKGYSITMPRPAACPKIPLMFAEHKVAVTPMQSGYRLGSTMEFAGFDETIHQRRLQLLTDAAEIYLREPYREPFEEAWFGWRPMTYDSVPIIGRSPRLTNAWIAAGHSMLGLSMAPATGKLMAELIAGETPHIDPQPLAVTRFG